MPLHNIALAIIGCLAHSSTSQPLSSSTTHSSTTVKEDSVQSVAPKHLGHEKIPALSGFQTFKVHPPTVYEGIPLELLAPERYDNITTKIFNASGYPDIVYDPQKHTAKQSRPYMESKSFLGINWRRIWDAIGPCSYRSCSSWCKKHQGLVWTTYDARQLRGLTSRMSQSLCGPGGISATLAKTWTSTVSVSLGPSLVSQSRGFR